MQAQSFFRTKEGGLSIAGLVILVSFPITLLGIHTGADWLSAVGLGLILLGMIYSPLRTYVFGKRERKEGPR